MPPSQNTLVLSLASYSGLPLPQYAKDWSHEVYRPKTLPDGYDARIDPAHIFALPRGPAGTGPGEYPIVAQRCDNCIKTRATCSRGQPCRKCKTSGTECVTSDLGWVSLPHYTSRPYSPPREILTLKKSLPDAPYYRRMGFPQANALDLAAFEKQSEHEFTTIRKSVRLSQSMMSPQVVAHRLSVTTRSTAKSSGLLSNPAATPITELKPKSQRPAAVRDGRSKDTHAARAMMQLPRDGTAASFASASSTFAAPEEIPTSKPTESPLLIARTPEMTKGLAVPVIARTRYVARLDDIVTQTTESAEAGSVAVVDQQENSPNPVSSESISASTVQASAAAVKLPAAFSERSPVSGGARSELATISTSLSSSRSLSAVTTGGVQPHLPTASPSSPQAQPHLDQSSYYHDHLGSQAVQTLHPSQAVRSRQTAKPILVALQQDQSRPALTPPSKPSEFANESPAKNIPANTGGNTKSATAPRLSIRLPPSRSLRLNLGRTLALPPTLVASPLTSPPTSPLMSPASSLSAQTRSSCSSTASVLNSPLESPPAPTSHFTQILHASSAVEEDDRVNLAVAAPGFAASASDASSAAAFGEQGEHNRSETASQSTSNQTVGGAAHSDEDRENHDDEHHVYSAPMQAIHPSTGPVVSRPAPLPSFRLSTSAAWTFPEGDSDSECESNSDSDASSVSIKLSDLLREKTLARMNGQSIGKRPFMKRKHSSRKVRDGETPRSPPVQLAAVQSPSNAAVQVIYIPPPALVRTLNPPPDSGYRSDVDDHDSEEEVMRCLKRPRSSYSTSNTSATSAESPSTLTFAPGRRLLDDSAVVQVHDMLYHLPRSRLEQQSGYFADVFARQARSTPRTVGSSTAALGLDRCQIYKVTGVSVKDFEALLKAYDDIGALVENPPSYPTLIAVFCASRTLRFGQLDAIATYKICSIWSPELFRVSPARIPYAAETVILSRVYNLPAVLKRAFYELLRTGGFDQQDLNLPDMRETPLDGSDIIGRAKLSHDDLIRLVTAREKLLMVWTLLVGSAPNTASFQCRLQVERSTLPNEDSQDELFRARAHCAEAWTNNVSIWADKVLESGFYETWMYDPICGLEHLIAMDWYETGFCMYCIRARQQVWQKKRREIWESLDLWLGL